MITDWKKQEEEHKKKLEESNSLLKAPNDLSESEKKVWEEIASLSCKHVLQKDGSRRRAS